MKSSNIVLPSADSRLRDAMRPIAASRFRALLALLLAGLLFGCDDGAINSIIDPPQWSAPVRLFEDDMRLAAGTRLHAVGFTGSGIAHRSSTDEGASWSDPVAIAGAGPLPIYGPLAAEGSNVYVLTRTAGALRVQRSTDDGLTWSAPVALLGYAADPVDRVQMDGEGDNLHIFVGRAGSTPNATFKVYYWRSTDAGLSFSDVATPDASLVEPPSPGGIAVEDGVVHIAYAAITDLGTLGHRARYLRSLDNGVTWEPPVDVSGPGVNPQIRPRPRVLDGRVLVLWEEPLDHNQAEPYPNATKSDIRATISRDNGTTWEEPKSVTTLPNDYENHPEVAVGPDGFFHVIYRLSLNQKTLTIADPMGYRNSMDYGASWGTHEIAIDDPTQETHPVNVVATSGFVHVTSPNGVYVRRPLR